MESFAPMATSVSPPRRGRSVLPLAEMRAFRADPLTFLEDLHRAHGPVVELRVLGKPILFASEPAVVQHVLASNAKNYDKQTLQQRLRIVLGDGLLTSEGELWKRRRRQVAPAFHHERMPAYADIV